MRIFSKVETPMPKRRAAVPVSISAPAASVVLAGAFERFPERTDVRFVIEFF